MSKTARKKLHRLTGRVRRMLAKTNGKMMWDVFPDSEDISERLRREEARGVTFTDTFLVRQVATDVLERHSDSMQSAIREEVSSLVRRFNPYAVKQTP